MTIRVSTIRRGDKVYRYVQLVESYRRERDGKPAVRLIASLGTMDDTAIANLKAALSASRDGKALVLPAVEAGASAEAEVLSNLRYLDLAVLLRLWDDLGLAALVHETVSGLSVLKADVERVICALVLQRCVAPASKLAAERWFPETALPELLAIAPVTFNNSRIHRSLEALEGGEAALQARLPSLVAQTEGQFGAVFIDATDTWFVGKGPPLAAKGIDKHGIYRRRVGIVLLCDERGFPLKWKTLSGKYHDATALVDMAAEAATLPWMQGKPVVLDRAVGKAAYVDQLAATKLQFVTALPAAELATCGAGLDWPKLSALQDACGKTPESVHDAALAAGFFAGKDGKFVQDLGLFNKKRSDIHLPSAAVAAIQIVRFMAENPELSAAEVGTRLGRSRTQVHRDQKLGKLATFLQDRVLAGDADAVYVVDLFRIAELPTCEQLTAFDEAILDAPPARSNLARASALVEPPEDLLVRGTLSFNTDVYLAQVAAEAETRKKLAAKIAAINAKLGRGRTRRKDQAILAEAGALILRKKLSDAVTPELRTTGGKREVILHNSQVAWARRRRAYGLMLIVSHPDVQGTAGEIVDTYFGRDAAEKDFQTIKSTLELRPVRHRCDVKLKAHVTLCMLALVLDRALRARLAAGKTGHTPASAYEILRNIHLNRVSQAEREFYTVTRAPAAAQEILDALGMSELAQTSQVRATITPR